jgi:hypothetical protein
MPVKGHAGNSLGSLKTDARTDTDIRTSAILPCFGRWLERMDVNKRTYPFCAVQGYLLFPN